MDDDDARDSVGRLVSLPPLPASVVNERDGASNWGPGDLALPPGLRRVPDLLPLFPPPPLPPLPPPPPRDVLMLPGRELEDGEVEELCPPSRPVERECPKPLAVVGRPWCCREEDRWSEEAAFALVGLAVLGRSGDGRPAAVLLPLFR